MLFKEINVIIFTFNSIPLLCSKTSVYRGIHYYIIFFCFKIDCGYSLEERQTCTHNLCFEQKNENNQNFSTGNDHFYSREKSQYIAWACYRNVLLSSSSRKNLRTKVTPDFHLTYSKNRGNLGSESK